MAALVRARNARRYWPGGSTTAPPPTSGSSLLTGLVAAYRFNHPTWDDDGPSNLDLTGAAAAGYSVGCVAARTANGAEFSNVGQARLTHALHAAFDLTAGADKTIALWVKPYTFNLGYFINLWHNTAAESRYRLTTNSSNKLILAIRPSSAGAIVTITHSTMPAMIANNWYPVIVRWDHTAQTISLRVYDTNGTAYDSTTSYTSGFTTGTNPLMSIGSSNTPTSMDGILDNLNFWSRLLTDAECNTWCNNRVGLEWPFDGTVEDVSTPPPDGTAFYASPAGSAINSGNIATPWDIATLLTGGPTGLEVNAALALLPNGTNLKLILRGGYYGGRFALHNLQGTALKHIEIRNYTGEKAVVDGYNFPNGNAMLDDRDKTVTYVDFVSQDDGLITQVSAAGRISDVATSTGASVVQRSGAKGVYLGGQHVRAIGVIVRDASDGVWMIGDADSAEAYGCILINNGWVGPATDRGHAHGWYTQNDGPNYKILQKMLSIGQFATGGKSYAEGTRVDYFKWLQNVMADNSHWFGFYWGNNKGMVSQVELEQYNGDAHDYIVKGNHAISQVIQPPISSTLVIGGTTGPNENVHIVGNYFLGGVQNAFVRALGAVFEFRHNVIHAQAGASASTSGDQAIELSQNAGQLLTGWSMDRNDWYVQGRNTNYLRFIRAAVNHFAATIAAWRAIFTAMGTTQEANSTLTVAAPTFKRTFVIPVSHVDYPTPGRAILVSYNYPLDNTVTFVLKHVITTSGAVSTGATTIPVNALTGTLNGQQTLTFGAVTVVVERPAVIGDTTLYVEAISAGISSGATATFDLIGAKDGHTWEIIDCHHMWDTAIDPADAAHFLYSNEFAPVATGTYNAAAPTIVLDVRTIANGGPLANLMTNPGGLYLNSVGAAINVPNPSSKIGVFLLRPTS